MIIVRTGFQAVLLAYILTVTASPAWAEDAPAARPVEKPVFSEGGESQMPATPASPAQEGEQAPPAKPASKGPVYKDEQITTSVDPSCDAEKDADKRNLCRATNPLDKQNQNRYQNKDHSDYYCSLIKHRDTQTLCYAVVNKNKTQCGLIINPNLEKECNAKVQ